MEKQKQLDDKLLAIMQFIHHYDPQVSLSTLLNGASFYQLIQHIPKNQYDFTIKISPSASKWSQKLQNLQVILYKIEEYFENMHSKCLQTSSVDLICLAKNDDLSELIQYFQIVMTLLMESSCKQDFIQSIMMLQETSQQIFVQIIKNSLDGCRFIKSKYQSNTFNRLINQFNEQKQMMERQIERLCKANMQLLNKIKQLEETIREMELDSSSRKSGIDNSVEDGMNVKYLEQYIDKLQLRILEQTKSYEDQKLTAAQKITQLQQKMVKLEQCEELSKIYKQKYDEIMDQMQKMNIWKKQKAKMEKNMQQKDFMVQKLHDRIEQLTQKNLSLQQSELQCKLQLQKKEIKIQRMSNQLKKMMQNIGITNSSFTNKLCQGSILDQSLKQCMNMNINMNNAKTSMQDSLFGSDDQFNALKKQNEKLLKRNKQFEKQICKLTKKVQRFRLLQEDKNKLEQLVFKLRSQHNEQLGLMFATFYQGFEQNLQTSKKLRYQIFNFNQNSQQSSVRKQKHSRKRTGSIKGKQNWKQANKL